MGTDNTGTLVDFVSSLSGGDGLRVEETLGNGYVRLRVAEAERRQAKHDIRCVEDAVIEMLRNARDAGARHIFVALSREEELRSVLVIDDGDGIPSSMHQKVFDARVTSKLDSMNMDRWGVHGRGMALYSIRENARACRVVASDVGVGASLMAVFDVREVRERADQSSWPKVTGRGGGRTITGPHNIVRTCVEFGLDTEDACKVYVGSPAEVVATMRARMRPSGATHKGTVPLAQRFAGVDDVRTLCTLATDVGLDMSERTAYRIVRGEIRPLRNVVLEVLGVSQRQRGSAHNAAPRKLTLTEGERDEFVGEVSALFSRLAEQYYLEIIERPTLRIADGIVTVSIPYGECD